MATPKRNEQPDLKCCRCGAAGGGCFYPVFDFPPETDPPFLSFVLPLPLCLHCKSTSTLQDVLADRGRLAIHADACALGVVNAVNSKTIDYSVATLAWKTAA